MADEFTTEDLQAIEEVLKEESEKEGEYLEEILKAKISDAAKNAIKGALRLMNKYKAEIGDPLKKLAALAGYGYAEPKKQEPKDDKDKEKYPYKKAYPEVKKSIQAFVPEDKRDDFDKLMKGVEVEETPIIDDPQVLQLMKERREDKDRIEKMERDLLVKEKSEVVTKELSNLNTTAEKFSPILLKIEKGEKLEESELKEFNEVLKAASNQISEQNVLLKELGSSIDTEGGSGAWAKIEKMAEARMKEDTKLSKAAAVEAVLETEDGRKLYAEYEKEAR